METAKSFEEKLDPDFFTLAFENILIAPDVLTEKYGLPADLVKEQLLGPGSVVFIGEDPIHSLDKTFRILTDTQTGAGFVDFYAYDASSGALYAYIGEEVMTAYGLYVLADEHPQARLTTHHDETVNVDLLRALTAAGYDVDTVNLRDRGTDLSEVDLLVISNPQKDFEKSAMDAGIRSEADRLFAFLENGGTVCVFADPYLKGSLPVLSEILADFGIAFSVDDESGLCRVVRDTENGLPTDPYTLICEYGTGKLAARLTEKLNGSVIVKSAGVLSLSGAAEPLLLSSSRATAEAGGKTADTAGNYAVAALSEKTYPNGKTGTVAVFSSIYLAIPDTMLSDVYENRDFFYALFENASAKSEGAPYGTHTESLTAAVLENMTLGKARGITAGLLCLPLAIALFGAVRLIRRRGR